MRALITGASGMVGRNLLEHPSAEKFEFLTPDRDELNLLDKHAVTAYMAQQRPDLVIHAAGRVGGIQANLADPVGYLVENSLMGIHVINEAYRAGVKKCINLGSSCMYPRNAKNPLKEEQILRGELEPTNEGYALAKITASRLAQYISRVDSESQYITIIPCNLYGRHDKFDPGSSHMIPAVIRKVHAACQYNLSSVEIWGDGEARREFMYAQDLADFVFAVIDKMRVPGEVPDLINVGIGQDYSINEYYRTIAEVVGFKGEFEHNLSRPIGMRQKLIDSSQAHRMGWRPVTTLFKGIQQTYRYYLEEASYG